MIIFSILFVFCCFVFLLSHTKTHTTLDTVMNGDWLKAVVQCLLSTARKAHWWLARDPVRWCISAWLLIVRKAQKRIEKSFKREERLWLSKGAKQRVGVAFCWPFKWCERSHASFFFSFFFKCVCCARSAVLRSSSRPRKFCFMSYDELSTLLLLFAPLHFFF